MKKYFLLLLVVGAMMPSYAQTLVHYWNFNNSGSESALLTPTSTLLTGAAIAHVQGGISAIQITSNTGQGFDITNPNARNSDASLTHLRFNDPIGGALVFSLPTTGYKKVVVKYATRRSGQGAGSQLVEYTTDGINYQLLDTIKPVDGDPTLATLDFSSIAAVNNNADFKIRITFAAVYGGTGGNNRFDNFTLEGNALPNTLVHYWNFNNSASESALLTATSSLVTGAAIAHIQGGISAIQTTSNTAQGFEVTNPNARNNDQSLTHLRFNDPIGGTLVFSLPTTGYKDVVVQYATRRSGQGAGSQLVEYTTDGNNYQFFDTIKPVDGNPTLAVLDFSSVAAVNDAADFKIRITFAANYGGTGGNNRFDNVTLEGNSLSGNDVTAPVVTIIPSNLSTLVAVNVQPEISFNENVRLVNNTALDNNNVDTIIELRLNDSLGTPVAFNASFASNKITVVPNTSLQNAATYYLALKADRVEDLSNNAVSSVQKVKFSTIGIQTIFQPGDLVPVAYRTSATATEDEIALLTLVDILPGTLINVTDAKYTTNGQPQCAGGLTWEAPASGVAAGTVISIQNDLPAANKGTLTGSKFGLSSGGDQVIVYTGTAANPVFVTALSTNAWLATNTSCSGSNSMLPAALTDGTTSINLSTATGNVSGNTANAYYNGIQSGTKAQLKAAILNPANWIGTAASTAPQVWPAWAFPGPPSVVSAKVLTQTSIQVVFSADLDNASATNPANFTGISGLSSITQTNNGSLADTLVLTFNPGFTQGNSYALNISQVKDVSLMSMTGVYTYNFSYQTTLKFTKAFAAFNEDAGTVQVSMELGFPSVGSVNLVVKKAPFSTADSADVQFTSQTLQFTGSSPSVFSLNIPLVNDLAAEQDEYLVLSLENESGLQVTGSRYFTLFIKDNDRTAKKASKEISLKHIGSFDPSTQGSTCEIVVHDPLTQRLFVTSAIQDRLDIVNFANPAAPVTIQSIDMSVYGGITSVAVSNGIVAVACPNANEQLDGSVVFFNTDGVFQKQVTVGALPDNIVFTPDGKKVLTANEGQPNAAYTVDPEGSVSIINLSGGLANLSQSNVTTLLFNSFNAQESALVASGVRKLFAASTLSQDFEPEYLTVSPDGTKAWVTLQENNAMAEINIANAAITSVWALGTKDYSVSGNGFDASDNNNEILIANWNVKAFYIPDAVANFAVGNKTYLVTANEGDEKEYTGLTERTTVNSVVLNPAFYPNADVLKQDHNLGRLRMTNLNGKNGNGQYDQIYVNGSRSFSIWDADTRALVYDSGDDFEMITSRDTGFRHLFNADNENNTRKSRSRAKGPEPEGVCVANIAGQVYAFVSLERAGGVMVYNVTNPAAVKFVDYINTRNKTTYGGDNGPEGIIYISPEQSPNGKAHILVANELSGTVSMFEIQGIPNANVSFGSTTLNLDEDAGTKTISINFSAPAPENTTISIKVNNGSGVQYGSDYTSNPAIVGDSLVIQVAKGTLSAVFQVIIIDDSQAENDETIGFTISTLSSAYLKKGTPVQMNVVIADNDPNQVAGVAGEEAFRVYPNPMMKDGSRVLNFNRNADVTVRDVQGRTIMKAENTDTINLPALMPGVYFICTSEGENVRLVIQ